jgi:hypothetical protein
LARTTTDAAERKVQRKATAEQVSATTGKKVGVRAAARQRKKEKAEPLPPKFKYRIEDRVLTFDAGDARRIGQIVARVVDYKIVRGGLALLSLQTYAADFAHTLTDASLVSQAHPLLITLDELFPDDDDAS